MPYFHNNKNLVKHVNKLTRQKKTLPFVLLETSCVNNMCHNQCLFYDDVFRLKGGWVGIPPFFRAALLVQWAKLLHVAKRCCDLQWFFNQLCKFHFRLDCVFFQQYLVLVQQLSCSLLGSGRFRGRTFMQQGPPTFRAVLAYRPLQSSSSTCSFILAGGGLAVLLQHNILSFLYTPEGTNSDLQELSRTAPALRLVTGNWTQVDTPSVASQQEDGFFP
jgi:hypothetical protein